MADHPNELQGERPKEFGGIWSSCCSSPLARKQYFVGDEK
jgi:hypothetical protein